MVSINYFVEFKNSFGKKLFIRLSNICFVEECQSSDEKFYSMIGLDSGMKFKVEEKAESIIYKIAGEVQRRK